MTTPRHDRITTADSHSAKRSRVIVALQSDLAEKPNRELARLLTVDEKMVRKYRAKLAKPKRKKR